jgi:hypothetical protein
MRTALALTALMALAAPALGQDAAMKPEDTEVHSPVPAMVTPGRAPGEAPSDAVVLFGGKDLSEWVSAKGGGPAGWGLQDGLMVVKVAAGDIQTRRSFGSYQLHLEWRVPKDVTGSGQQRGNSGLFLGTTGPGAGYEIQILDPWNNPTYVNGQAGAIYKQSPPLVNPGRPPGEWQVYDIVWTAPVFTADGALKAPARVTAFLNGVLVQNDFELKGVTKYIGRPDYKVHGPLPIMLQAHGGGDNLAFRNIWIRPLDGQATR